MFQKLAHVVKDYAHMKSTENERKNCTITNSEISVTFQSIENNCNPCVINF